MAPSSEPGPSSALRLSELLEYLQDAGGGTTGLTGDVGEDVPGGAFGQEPAVFIHDLVSEGETPRPELRQPRLDADRVVVAGRPAVLAFHAGHQDEKPGVLHHAIRHPRRPAVVGPPDLEPHDVMAVIDDSHPIRLGVTDAQRGLNDTHVVVSYELRVQKVRARTHESRLTTCHSGDQ